jgi:uncharacterized protein (DUF58 family)
VLTRRGWSVLGGSSGLLVGSRVLGLVQLVVLATAGLLALAAAWSWVRAHRPELVARRHLRERLQVGVDGRVDVVVESTSPRPLPTMAVVDAFDRGRRSARFLLAPLRPGDQARAAYRIPTDRRGRFELGPLRATVSDPFGLASRARRVLAAEEVIVYPRVHELLPLPEAGGTELDRDLRRAHGRLDASGEFHTLREYRPGDDLRRVHWRSTARRDRLMVRQHESRRRAPVLVLLDVRPGAHDRASFERAVEACASVASALERAGRPWQMALGTGVLVGAPGRRHLVSVMDELAVVQPHGGDRLAPALTRRRTGALVAVMGRTEPPDAVALGALVRGGGSLTLVATRDDGVPAVRTRVRPMVVRFFAEEEFVASWNEAVLAWQRSARLPSVSHAAP